MVRVLTPDMAGVNMDVATLSLSADGKVIACNYMRVLSTLSLFSGVH